MDWNQPLLAVSLTLWEYVSEGCLEGLTQLNICLHTLASLHLSTQAMSVFAATLRRPPLTGSRSSSSLQGREPVPGAFPLRCAGLSWPFRKTAHDESETQRTPASTQC